MTEKNLTTNSYPLCVPFIQGEQEVFDKANTKSIIIFSTLETISLAVTSLFSYM